MLDTLGGRKFVFALVASILVAVLAAMDKVTGVQALYAITALSGSFTLGNAAEHFAVSSAIKKGDGS